MLGTKVLLEETKDIRPKQIMCVSSDISKILGLVGRKNLYFLFLFWRSHDNLFSN